MKYHLSLIIVSSNRNEIYEEQVIIISLTHCGLVTPYAVIDIGQH